MFDGPSSNIIHTKTPGGEAEGFSQSKSFGVREYSIRDGIFLEGLFTNVHTTRRRKLSKNPFDRYRALLNRRNAGRATGSEHRRYNLPQAADRLTDLQRLF